MDFLFGIGISLIASIFTSYLYEKINKKGINRLTAKIKIRSQEFVINALDITKSLEQIKSTLKNIKERPTVFISYSHKDKKLIEKLKNTLEENNINVWHDTKDLMIGDNISKSINEGIEQSNWVVPIITKNYLNSPWTKFELEKAIEAESYRTANMILPVAHDFDELPPSLLNRKYIVWKNDDEKSLQELIRFIKQSIETSEPMDSNQ